MSGTPTWASMIVPGAGGGDRALEPSRHGSEPWRRPHNSCMTWGMNLNLGTMGQPLKDWVLQIQGTFH